MSEPILAACADCGAPVLLVQTAMGVPYVAEPREVTPLMPCPNCGGRPRDRADCEVCDGSGKVGEALPATGDAVRLEEFGTARAHNVREGRKRGEAVHRLHRCAVAARRVA